LASTANIAAFNLGNAFGAWLGGLAIDAGLGYTSPSWIGAALAFAGLVVAVVSGLVERRQQAWVPSTSSGTTEAGVTFGVSSPST
jgi:DHA1 family inner membrane transport protein